MAYVIVWFILTNGSGYRPPLDVKDPPCGIVGPIVGVQVDRLVNPTAVLWPDPKIVGAHCRVDIRDHVEGLAPGEYHVGTTIVAKEWIVAGSPPEFYIGHDPHTSPLWMRQIGPSTNPARPAGLGIKPRPGQ